MRAVADASPLIFLARLELLELLDELYEEVLVPRTVMKEATAANRPGAAEIMDCPWLVGIDDPSRIEAEAVERHLGAGETLRSWPP